MKNSLHAFWITTLAFAPIGMLAQDLTQGDIPPFGLVYQVEPSSGWKYIPDIGWQYVAISEETSLFSWSSAEGWLYTTASFENYLWSFDDSAWIDYGIYETANNYVEVTSYDLLRNKSYRTIGKYDAGLGTENTPVYDHWTISFTQTQALWRRYDVAETLSVESSTSVALDDGVSQYVIKINPYNNYLLIDGKKYIEQQ